MAALFRAILTQINVRRGVSYLLTVHLGVEIVMMDFVMVGLAFSFFAVSIAYVYACDRL